MTRVSRRTGFGLSVTNALAVEFVEQELCLLEIGRTEALGEPAVDRREQIASFIPLILITPKPRHAHCCAESDVKLCRLLLHTPVASDKHFLVKLVLAAP